MPTASTSASAAETGPRDWVLVAVVGSVNLDIVIEVAVAPQPGQTVLGSAFSEHGGGKGGNQAIAAARLAPTAFIGAIGEDPAGDLLRANLVRNEVDVGFLQRSGAPSGRAFITLTGDAENSIIVLQGANATLTGASVKAALDEAQPLVLLAQHEIRADAIVAAADWAAANSRRFLFNASPVAPIAATVLSAANPLIVNADEAREILAAAGSVTPGAGIGEDPAQDLEHDLARRLLAVSESVIVTGGKRGAFVAQRGDERIAHVATQPVPAVDTTGAGDEFAGTVAASLALGESLRRAAERAAAASARLVQLRREDR